MIINIGWQPIKKLSKRVKKHFVTRYLFVSQGLRKIKLLT